MKKITTTLTAIILMIFLIMGCDKYHRDRYTGTWDFVITKYIHEYDDLGIFVKTEYDTIYSYTGKIKLGNYENNLIIQYSENDEIIVHVDNDGSFRTYSIPPDISVGGKFEDRKNIYFYLLFWNKLDSSGNYVNTGRYDTNGTKKGRR